jgi:hypothetical protein
MVDCGGKVPITGETVKQDRPALSTTSVGAAPSTTRSGALYVFQWNGSGSGELFATTICFRWIALGSAPSNCSVGGGFRPGRTSIFTNLVTPTSGSQPPPVSVNRRTSQLSQSIRKCSSSSPTALGE